MEKGYYYHFKVKHFNNKFIHRNIKYEPTLNSITTYKLIPDQHIYILKIIDNIWCAIQYYNSIKQRYEYGYIMHMIQDTNDIDYIINPYFEKLNINYSEYD